MRGLCEDQRPKTQCCGKLNRFITFLCIVKSVNKSGFGNKRCNKRINLHPNLGFEAIDP